jgi:hypothetical protein
MGQASSIQFSMSLFLGFVNKKVSLAYGTYKEDKMSIRRGEEGGRGKASTPVGAGLALPNPSAPPAFPGFPWVGLRRAKLCESKRRALLCVIPSRFSASQSLLLRRAGSAKVSAGCFLWRLVESEFRPVHGRAMRKGREGIRLGARYFRPAPTAVLRGLGVLLLVGPYRQLDRVCPTSEWRVIWELSDGQICDMPTTSN